jgi:4-amino-4-deoxy-L-arabinose transferase-like glycosyltransferase
VHRGPLLLVVTVALLLALAASAGASNATLRTTLNNWSKKVGADAHSVALAAQRRHPRRMTYSANRFHRDALRARAAVAAQKPSTAKGRHARRLALTGFANYALAGSKWAACGRARLAQQRAAAIGYSKVGANYAHTGNKLLVAAGKLLR